MAEEDDRMDRKSLFQMGLGYLGKMLAESVEKKLDLVPRTAHRPPGALVESLFLATCDGSANCVRACPYEAIRLVDLPGISTDRTPALTPTRVPCYLCIDVPCASACPSGALSPIKKSEIKLGLAVVNQDACFAWQGEPCALCVQACPIGSAALVQVTGKGPRVIAEGCTGCGVCTNVCPSRPRAIRIKPQ